MALLQLRMKAQCQSKATNAANQQRKKGQGQSSTAYSRKPPYRDRVCRFPFRGPRARAGRRCRGRASRSILLRSGNHQQDLLLPIRVLTTSSESARQSFLGSFQNFMVQSIQSFVIGFVPPTCSGTFRAEGTCLDNKRCTPDACFGRSRLMCSIQQLV